MMKKRSWLPDGVTEYRDRHGKARHRFRKSGYVPHHFSAAPGTEAFREEYATCSVARLIPRAPSKALPGSFDELAMLYYQSPKWLAMLPASQTTYRGIIERFRNKHGPKPIALVTTGALDKIFGRMAETPAAANNLRKVLRRMFRYAVKIGKLKSNPADATDAFRQGKGFHTWSEAEIAQFRARHPLGTKARLAMELFLNTAARRCNIASLTRAQMRDGKFTIQHVKGNNETIVPVMAETLAAIEAMPVAGIGHFLVTKFGKPFTPAGFGNWFRECCNEAELPHCSAHGLRKAMSRRLAESGSTDAEGRSVTGHVKNATFAYYAQKANREGLADNALANLENRILANLTEK